jgi:nucleotide-binding universal stress UspA family protein
MAALALRRRAPRADVFVASAGGRPVMLATLEVPFDEEAAAFAVDAAVECGQPLIVANVVEMPLGPACLAMGYGDLEPTEEEAAKLRAPAELAHALGVRVERLRVRSPHPTDALVELVVQHRPGLLVFGPDRTRLRARRYRKAARAVTERAGCLVWLAD